MSAPLVPQAEPERAGVVRRVVDSLFGFDYFVSYAWAGRPAYAANLAAALTGRGFRVFLDRSPEDGFFVGEHLAAETARAVRSSTCLVAVVEQQAFASRHVPHEVALALKRVRPIVAVDLDGTLSRARRDPEFAANLGSTDLARSMRHTLLDRLGVTETVPDTDVPSPEVVQRLVESFRSSRRMVRRIRWLGFVACVLFALGVVALIQQRAAVRERERALEASNRATSRELAARATLVNSDGRSSELAALIAAQGLARADTAEARFALSAQLRMLPTSSTDVQAPAPVDAVASLDDGGAVVITRARSALTWRNDGTTANVSRLVGTTPPQVIERIKDYARPPVAISRDGTRIAIPGPGSDVEIFDLQSGARRARLAMPTGEFDADFVAIALAFSPDGQSLAIGTDEGFVRLWDVATGDQVRGWSPFRAGRGIGALMFNPTGELLAVGADAVTLLSAVDGTTVGTFDRATVARRVSSLAFSPDGRRLAVGYEMNGTEIIHVETRQRVPRISSSVLSDSTPGALYQGAVVTALSFSRDGRLLATADAEGQILVWDSMRGSKVAACQMGERIRSVLFSQDSRQLKVAAASGLLRSYSLPPSTNHVGSDSATVAGYTNTGAHLIVKIAARGPVYELMNTRTGQLSARLGDEVSYDGRFYVESGDSALAIHETVTAREVSKLPVQRLNRSALSPGGELIAIVEDRRNIRIVAVPGGELVTSWNPAGAYVSTIAFSPDGNYVASSAESTVEVRRTPGASTLAGTFQHDELVSAVAISTDSRLLAIAGGASIRVFRIADGTQISHVNVTDPVTQLAFLRDVDGLVSLSDHGLVQLWSLDGARELERADVSSGAAAAARNRSVTAQIEPAPTIIVDPTGREVARTDRLHLASDDGVWKATFNSGTIRVVDVTRAQTYSFDGYDSKGGYLRGIGLSPRGTYLIARYSFLAKVLRVVDGKELGRMPDARYAFSADEKQVFAIAQSTVQTWELPAWNEHPLGALNVVRSPDTSRCLVIKEVFTERTTDRICSDKPLEWNLALSRNGEVVATIHSDRQTNVRRAEVFSVRTQQPLGSIAGVEGGPLPVAISSRGTYVAASLGGPESHVYRVAHGKLERIAALKLDDAGYLLQFSEDERLLAVGTTTALKILELPSAREVGRVPDYASSAAFSHDGATIAVIDTDNQLQVLKWRAPDLLKEMCERVPRDARGSMDWARYLADQRALPLCER